MMFIVRGKDGPPHLEGMELKMARATPAVVPDGGGKADYFCVGEAEIIGALRERGLEIVELRDGWYADDAGGGVAISGQGRYWEVRDTLFTVKEAVGSSGTAADSAAGDGELVNVRRAIFGI
jgi:hypothetical protein